MKSLRRNIVIPILAVIISFFTSSVLFANGIEKKKSVSKEYFTLDPNTKLTYETTFGETICVTRQDGDEYVQELKSDDFVMNQRLNITDDKYCVIDLQQEIDVFLFITHSVDVTYNEPAPLVGLPLNQNEKWEWTGIEYVDDNVDTLFITTEYAGDETIITTAGEFNCKKINYVIKKSSGKVTKYYEWRTPGIGLVKFEADLDPKGFIGTLQELLGYDEIYFSLKKVENIN
ncbi:MAG: hypothetical protein JSW63_08330 [Ignavibacterium sp.]|nr:MAG: hypothetical protein JSW63_08330 [Ignavibacterium sp.]